MGASLTHEQRNNMQSQLLGGKSDAKNSIFNSVKDSSISGNLPVSRLQQRGKKTYSTLKDFESNISASAQADVKQQTTVSFHHKKFPNRRSSIDSTSGLEKETEHNLTSKYHRKKKSQHFAKGGGVVSFKQTK